MDDIIDKGECPVCHSKNDGHTEVNGAKVNPKDNDLTICAYCGTLAKYKITGNVRDIVALADEETEEYMKAPEVQKAMAFARAINLGA